MDGIEIDFPDWFDQYVAAPVEWMMRPDLFGFPNVMAIVAIILGIMVIGGVVHRKHVRQLEREHAARARQTGAYVDDHATRQDLTANELFPRESD